MEKVHHLLNAIKTAALSKRKYAYAHYNKISQIILTIFLREGFILGYTLESRYYKIELNQKFPYQFITSPYKPGNKQYFSRYFISSKYGWAIVSSGRGIEVWPHSCNGGIVVCGIPSQIL